MAGAKQNIPREFLGDVQHLADSFQVQPLIVPQLENNALARRKRSENAADLSARRTINGAPSVTAEVIQTELGYNAVSA